ncbi:MAG: hypothetical protein MJ077_00835 [Oscillospiraceae bacterium]|nr:hypothetical protein [Oscillospiraceae bacterium]
MTASIELRYVRGHIEVFNSYGDFLFSADTASEAYEELSDWEEDLVF